MNEAEESIYYIVSSYDPVSEYSHRIAYCDTLEEAIECGIKNQRYRFDRETGRYDVVAGSEDEILIEKVTDLNRYDWDVIRLEKTLREWLQEVA